MAHAVLDDVELEPILQINEVTEQSLSDMDLDGNDEEDELGESAAALAGWNDGAMASTPKQTVGSFYLICLTVGIGGLQVIWTAIMSQGSPYLLSLQVPPSLISLVWLAGPLCGTIVQPYVGLLSDRCEHPLGRRRPFIIVGTVATMICMLALSWSADVVTLLFELFAADPGSRYALAVKGFTASAWIWALNVSIQPVQSGLRAILVDCCPPKQQVQACAYASCAAGIGSIVGYASGYVALPRYLPWFGDTELKGLGLVASFLLGSSASLTCYFVQEKRFNGSGAPRSQKSVVQTIKKVLNSVRTTPKPIRKICMVQFFAWLAWFPFLFYGTTYISHIYQNNVEPANAIVKINMPAHVFPLPTAHSIRHATFVMVLFSAVALSANLLLPLLMVKPQGPKTQLASEKRPSSSLLRWRLNLAIPGFTLIRAWTASHVLYSVLVLCTLATRNFAPTAVLVSILGLSWAVTQWVPLALISAEIIKDNSKHAIQSSHYAHVRTSEEEPAEDQEAARVEPVALQAGTVMGVYNIAIAAPQIVAAMQCSVLFWFLGLGGIVGGEASGWVIRIGAVSALIAAWLADAMDN